MFYVVVSKGKFRQVILQNLLDFIQNLYVSKTLETVKHDRDFVKCDPYTFPKHSTIAECCLEVQRIFEQTIALFPDLIQLQPEIEACLHSVSNFNSVTTYLKDFYTLFTVQSSWLNLRADRDNSDFEVEADEDYLKINIKNSEIGWSERQDAISSGSTGNQIGNTILLRSVAVLLEALRRERRKPSRTEFLAIRVAYQLLEEGKRLVYPYRPWGNSGFRNVQTYMSITDPGEGHLFGTTQTLDRMNGVVVHIEHLERGNYQDRNTMESYRIPAIKTLAKVRLHVGADAPCSSYVGRPVFESEHFEASLLKAVNTFSSGCTAMFMDGLAECKIAIDRVTATQAIRFMQCLVGATRRDKTSQAFSAAFNINTPILDDREITRRKHNGKPVWVLERMAIAKLGIELAVEGGFDKVTWDGAANTYPSTCILEQLSHAEAVELVHTAHERGLLTYFSAGFRFHHLPQAVHTGVDGVGVGGAQILRYMDAQTGFHGPFKHDNIETILKIRDEAEQSELGQAAAMLARLDRLYFEGCINVSDNSLRLALFEAVQQQDPLSCNQLMKQLEHIWVLPFDTEHPLVEWGKRLICASQSEPLCAEKMSVEEWSSLLHYVSNGVATQDLELLAEGLSSIRAYQRITRLRFDDSRSVLQSA
jgi:hypothetical protein